MTEEKQKSLRVSFEIIRDNDPELVKRMERFISEALSDDSRKMLAETLADCARFIAENKDEVEQ